MKHLTSHDLVSMIIGGALNTAAVVGSVDEVIHALEMLMSKPDILRDLLNEAIQICGENESRMDDVIEKDSS